MNRPLRVLELYSGTQSIGKEFRKKGHIVLSVDINPLFTTELFGNLEQWTISVADVTAEEVYRRLGGKPDVIWASPLCTTHSVASIGRHRHKTKEGWLIPKSELAKEHDVLMSATLKLINQIEPDLWFIENPRAGMRKAEMMQPLNPFRHTVTYCQYGDTRMKPTDIWTNHPEPRFKPPCNNGDSCHVSAPRGSQVGTQGMKNAILKAVIPPKLCEHIVQITEERLCA